MKMAGFDKLLIEEKLKKLGWKEDSNKKNYYIPPEELWGNKPESFYIYSADELQELLDNNADQT